MGFKYNENQVLDASFLDTISSIRLALEHVATCISRQIEDPQMVNESFDLKQFLRVTSEFLKQSNEPVREFVIKEICLKYRIDAVLEMKKQTILKQLLPLALVEDENPFPDLFLIEGRNYEDMKTLVVQSFVHSNFGNLKGYLDSNPDRNLVSSLMLSLFYCLYHQTKVKFTEEAVGRLQNFLQEEKDRWKTVPHFQHFTDRISKHKEHAFYIHESKREKDIK